MTMGSFVELYDLFDVQLLGWEGDDRTLATAGSYEMLAEPFTPTHWSIWQITPFQFAPRVTGNTRRR
jgi:hypothetical protein